MIPIDSTDAREQRELEQARSEAAAHDVRLHDAECRGGWRGQDAEGRPRACLRCRPHLAHVACRICSVPWQSCQNLTSIRRGPCCTACDHRPANERHPL
jgi:hypothetical protein